MGAREGSVQDGGRRWSGHPPGYQRVLPGGAAGALGLLAREERDRGPEDPGGGLGAAAISAPDTRATRGGGGPGQGVPAGSRDWPPSGERSPLPRTPHVFEEQTKWALENAT